MTTINDFSPMIKLRIFDTLPSMLGANQQLGHIQCSKIVFRIQCFRYPKRYFFKGVGLAIPPRRRICVSGVSGIVWLIPGFATSGFDLYWGYAAHKRPKKKWYSLIVTSMTHLVDSHFYNQVWNPMVGMISIQQKLGIHQKWDDMGDQTDMEWIA